MGNLFNSLPFILACVFAAGKVYGAGSASPDTLPPGSTTIKAAPEVTVPFDLYNGYLIVARGSAGSLKNLNFLVDTGTSLPILDARIARKLRLQKEASASIIILGGRAQGGEAVLPSLEFGTVQQSNLRVVTTDLSFFSKVLPVRIDAIVGLDVMGEKAFVIDYAARVIRFGPLPALPFSIPLRLDRGVATFDAEIDHAPVHLAFDTGAGSVVLFDKAMPLNSERKVDAVQTRSEIGGFARKPVRLRSVKLGEEEFRQKSAILVDNPKPSQLDFDGLMSPAALGISRVSIDLKGGVLAFSR